ncbi:CHASE2 domain-containing protein [Lacibacter sp. H375]|uniref:CHASE2 domain-containing protein n=1 Tax=Lacibacter sp. H375 TaxID=3133424 RepID=UPI0030BC59B2
MHSPPKPPTGKKSTSFFKRAYQWLNHFYLRYLFKRDTILSTFSVFIVIGLFSLLPLNTGILNPFKTALKDLDFNDISYSVLNKNENTPIDNRIVILNIGNADRMGLALMIEKLRIAQPKVIGLDVNFNGPKEQQSDSLLRHMIGSTPNLVIVSQLDWTRKTDPEKIGYFGVFTSNRGYANLIGEEGGTIRNFSPFEKSKSKIYTSFPAAIVAKADSAAFIKLKNRKREYEVIHYSRKLDQYMLIEGTDLLDDNIAPELFKDKIVLMGYINPDPFNVEDKHFTPLNKQFAGKSTPDMNGIVIHANIISMILDGKYIRDIPSGIFWVITILIAWLHVALFMRYYIEDHIWFHLVAKVAQIFFAILSVYVGIMCFDWFSIKIDTKISLIVIILAIDIIYFYEALAVWLHTKFGFQTSFHSKSH